MKNNKEVSMDMKCTDDIPSDIPVHIKITGLIIFVLVLIII